MVYEVLAWSGASCLQEVVELIEYCCEQKWLERNDKTEGRCISGGNAISFYSAIKYGIKLRSLGYARLAELDGGKSAADANIATQNNGSPFIDVGIVKELRELTSDKFDLCKLVRFCEELNDAYGRGNYLSSILLIRAIMNHVPPIFGQTKFSQVVANAGRSLKNVLERLSEARSIADLHTHATIRRNEPLPTKNQVEPNKTSFEHLIQEVIVQVRGLNNGEE